MSKQKRKPLSQKVKNNLLIESGHRCAIHTCKAVAPLEFAHIEDYDDGYDDSSQNLIVLCKSCHGRFDHDKKNAKFYQKMLNSKAITVQQMKMYKSNLRTLNQRYYDFERRVFERFAETTELEILLSIGIGSEIFLRNAVKDDLLVSRPSNHGQFISGEISYEMAFYYTLTKRGEDFIKEFYPEI